MTSGTPQAVRIAERLASWATPAGCRSRSFHSSKRVNLTAKSPSIYSSYTKQRFHVGTISVQAQNDLFSKINDLVKANIKIRSDLCHIAVGVQIYSSILIVELLDKNDMRN